MINASVNRQTVEAPFVGEATSSHAVASALIVLFIAIYKPPKINSLYFAIQRY